MVREYVEDMSAQLLRREDRHFNKYIKMFIKF